VARSIIGQRRIISATTIANAPPGGALNGQIHIVGPVPTGTFAAFAPNSIATWDGIAGVWRNTPLDALDGWAVLDFATKKQYFHDGTTLREVAFAGGGGGAYVFTNTDRLYGRDTAGGGAGEEISVGGGLEFTGTLGIRIAASGVQGSMLRNSAALSVLGLAGTVAGPPADIATTALSAAVLRESGSAIGWGLLGNANLAANAGINKTKLENSGALAVLARSLNSPGPPADLAATAASGFVLRESGSTIGWGLLLAANLAANAGITRGQLANGAALSVVGVAANAAGAPADIAATAAGNGVLRESGSTIGWGLLASANLAAAAGITRGQLANAAGLSVVGNAGMAAAPPADLVAAQGSAHVLREAGGSVGWGLIANANISATAGIASSKFANSAARSVIGNAASSVAPPSDIVATSGSFGVLQEATGNLVWGPITNGNVAAGAGIAKSKLESSVGCSVVGRSINSAGPTADIAAGADGQFLTRKAGVVAFTTPNLNTTVYQKTFDTPTLWGQSTTVYPTLVQTNPTFFTPADAERHFCGFIMSNGNINWLRFAFQVPADIVSTGLTPRLVVVLNGAPGSALLNLVVRGAYFSDNDVSSGGTAFFQGVNMSLAGYSAADYVIVDLPALAVAVAPGQYVQGVIERHAKANPNDTYADIIGIASISFRGTRSVVTTFPDLPRAEAAGAGAPRKGGRRV
jgi:hypothetical protein